MVVSEAMRVWASRDKAPVTEALATPEAQDASESSWATPRSVGQCPSEREAYLTLDALKNIVSTMTDTIMQQVSEQVRKAIEAASSARPLLYFKYAPTIGCGPFHRHIPGASHRHSDERRAVIHTDGNDRSRGDNRNRSIGADPIQNRRPSQGRLAKSTMASTPYAMHSRRTAWLEEQEQTSRPQKATLGRRHSPQCRHDRERTRSPPPRGASGQGSRRDDWSPPRHPRVGLARRSTFVVGVQRRPETHFKVSRTATQVVPIPFFTPFSIEIINASCYGKVTMPVVDIYDGTTKPEEHLGVYKAQMYV